MLTKLLISLPLVTAVLGAPLTIRQNPSPGDDDDGLIFSPANGTTIDSGSTFNFTYLCDDDDTTSVDVALIRYIRIGAEILGSGGSSRNVNAQVSLPEDIRPGRYLIAVDERDNDDDDDAEDDDNVGNDWSAYDIVSRTNNAVKNPYWVTVTNTSSVVQRSIMTRQDRIDDDDDDEAILTSPVNGTALAPEAEFNFEYTCDDECNSVRLALVRFYRVLNGTITETRGEDQYVSATIAIPDDIPEADYVLGINERDANDVSNDDDDVDDDNDDLFDLLDDYSDYDIKFSTPERDDERVFVVTVQNGTDVA